MTDRISLGAQRSLFAVCIMVAAYAPSEVLWRKTDELAILKSVLIAPPAAAPCRQFAMIKAVGVPINLALVAGSVVAIASALALSVVMVVSDAVLTAIVPKSVTTAVAIGIIERLGGVSGVSAAIVIVCGIFGATCGPSILAADGVPDEAALRFASGLATAPPARPGPFRSLKRAALRHD